MSGRELFSDNREKSVIGFNIAWILADGVEHL